jgi:kanamycin nucleotidyltransferase
MWNGPQPQSRVQRLLLADRIVADLHRVYGDSLKAIALYGSLSRGTDGDYSDVELWCVVSEPGLDARQEWVYGEGKAEVNFYGEDVMLARTVEVDAEWSLSQGEIMNCRPLFGDRTYFQALRERVMSPPKQAFDEVIAEMGVGEFYEWMGKIRNGVARNDLDFLPVTTCNFTLHMALMAALLHRHIYSTSSALMRETLALPTLPQGYRELAQMVMAGQLHDKPRVVDALEATWAGIGPWLAQHGVEVGQRTQWPWAK